MKQGVIENGVHRTTSTSNRHPIPLQQSKTDIHLEFKPLVQVDPSVLLKNRQPLQNPRTGDYLLKQTASTEAMASKKSLELKKRYLLGENTLSSGIMKSDSTSMLDSKFKNFHSTITGCQKLLNPAPDISPAMQTFLKNTMIADAKLSSSGETIPARESLKSNEERDKRESRSEEKENVYDQIVNTKNELNKFEVSEVPKAVKNHDSNNVLIENMIKDAPPSKVIETIDLVTPEKEKLDKAEKTIEDADEKCRIDVSENKIKIQQPGERRSVCDVIDLTLESSIEEPKSPKKSIGETEQLNMPSIAWVSSNCNRQDSSSSKTSSESSPAEYSHHILESTSPSTQATPIEETKEHKIGEDLMQMDSLMIIDGKYIGDPEDLKHMKMPESMKKPIENVITNDLHAAAAREIRTSDKLKPIEKVYKYESIYKRPELKFDAKNENKIDSLKNLPLILPSNSRLSKPDALNLSEAKKLSASDQSDNDKTPTVANPGNLLSSTLVSAANASVSLTTVTATPATTKTVESTKTTTATTPTANPSDSETETTGQVFTETELSDWTADDAVSENFVDIEFALNSNKGTIKRNKKKKQNALARAQAQRDHLLQMNQCPIVKDLDFDGIEFMDTGSEESCMETYAATNKAMLENRGYVRFVDTNVDRRNDGFVSRQHSNENACKSSAKNASEVRGIDFVEQGACILSSEIDLKTPVNELPSMFAPKARAESGESHDIEEDSLVMIASQGGNTTTEESDALTVVTSPLEPTTPRNVGDSSKSETPKKNRHSFGSDTTSTTPAARKDSDEITYEDYVRQLQMKITQISNARDSIDIRKTKRKHSKGDLSSESIELRKSQETLSNHDSLIDKHNGSSNKSLSIYVGKSDTDKSPATVIEKLEEITKERTKRKDLIHDLVMDKLQSKKQLNAEKRLSRNRNRSSALSISPMASSVPPPPPIASSSMTNISNAPNTASAIGKTSSMADNRFSAMQLIDQERKFAAMQGKRSQRPHSENVDEYFATPKLNKTQSFCAYGHRQPSHEQQNYQNQFADQVNVFSTPILPSRRKADDDIVQSTEKMRQDARLRARLKSNQDLGLSPEEKIELLRKRYHLDGGNASKFAATPSKSSHLLNDSLINKSDDMKVRERKMMASKSVNDIAAANLLSGDSINGIGSNQKHCDFTSDPNLVEEKTPTKRRHKDPERRKSIIQAVSDFFHKKRDKEPASPKEKSEGMFGRFRISPKSKSKVRLFGSGEPILSFSCTFLCSIDFIDLICSNHSYCHQKNLLKKNISDFSFAANR